MEVRFLGTRFSDSGRLTVGLDDPGSLFQPKRFHVKRTGAHPVPCHARGLASRQELLLRGCIVALAVIVEALCNYEISQ